MIVDSDLLSMQQARILAENAFCAQKKLAAFSQERLDAIVEHVAACVKPHAASLARQCQEETHYGNAHDKEAKNLFVCGQALEALRGMRCVGVVAEDTAKGTLDVGVPLGVIAALCPATSPVSTALWQVLLAIKSGNAIVFSPHPRVIKTLRTLFGIVQAAAAERGLPEGCIAYLETVSKSGALELMRHPAVSLIMAASAPTTLPDVLACGKPVIFGGTGNGPAFIERTANIPQAVADIVASKSFDYGMAPSAEQSVVVEACIAHEVEHAMQAQGVYFMTEAEATTLAGLLFCTNGGRKPAAVGLSAQTLASRAGFLVPQNTRVLAARRAFVSEADPYSRELLAPVLAYYVEADWMHACEKCIELLLHEKNGHTLVIHSNSPEVIRQFALKKPVARMLVNTPAAFGGMGMTTNLFPSMILGSGSAGRGITADNVSPLHLTYIRKIGYGVRPCPGVQPCTCAAAPASSPCLPASQEQSLEALRRLLAAALGGTQG